MSCAARRVRNHGYDDIIYAVDGKKRIICNRCWERLGNLSGKKILEALR